MLSLVLQVRNAFNGATYLPAAAPHLIQRMHHEDGGAPPGSESRQRLRYAHVHGLFHERDPKLYQHHSQFLPDHLFVLVDPPLTS